MPSGRNPGQGSTAIDAVLDNLDIFAEGFRRTVALSVLAAVAALLVGTALAAMRVSPVPPLRWFGTAYVQTVRNTPLTVMFFFVVFVLPQVGVVFSYFVFAVVALSIYHAALVCEAVRSGINGVDVGQAEAARALGLTFSQNLRLIVLPQAFRNVLQPLGSVLSALIRNTSIAAAFGVQELTGVVQRLTTANPDSVIAVLLGGMVGYLILTLALAGALALAERRAVTIR
ncbi:Glutamate transport system permease protein GluC [Frankia canadensis]|uniref:Glutamate transport system permease protein GluC n=1 Tax=Frankia canadensis TaxID=1836972 RepID=A0A2I2KTR7_9ACTN|nr:Glutamate transport system permease protein GluC [Frankia canadensis]SOU56353.1 Glutamate transport system permease protein GluC [Frankia canadensis]